VQGKSRHCGHYVECCQKSSPGLAMELRTGWWGGYGERRQRCSIWLANQACFSFVIVPKARVEGSSATCGIQVGSFRV
jgi:hypothetical protein